MTSISRPKSEPEYICVRAPDVPMITLLDGTVFPEAVDLDVLVKNGSTTTVVSVELEVRRGLPVVNGVSILQLDESGGRNALTPTVLHNLNFGRIIEEAIRLGGYMGVGFKNPLRDREAARAAANRSVAIARRRQPLTDELVREVVDIIRGNKYDPRKQVASRLNVSERTASRWIAAARQRGLLDEGVIEHE